MLLLRGKDDFTEWARLISMAIQERYPEASIFIHSQENTLTEDEMKDRVARSDKMSTRCMEDLESDEPDESEDVDVYKIYTFKYERRNKLRQLVTSTIGFIQQRMSADCIHTIKQLSDRYTKSIKEYDLFDFWLSINEAMAAKGIQKAAASAKALMDISTLRQEMNESIADYVIRFSKKAEELMNKEGLKVSETVLSCIFINNLGDVYNGYKNHMLNQEGEELKLMAVKEGAIRWTVNDAQENVMVTLRRNNQPFNRKYAVNKEKQATNKEKQAMSKERYENRKGKRCFACNQIGHMMRNCPRVQQIAAVAWNGEDESRNKEYKDNRQGVTENNARTTSQNAVDDSSDSE